MFRNLIIFRLTDGWDYSADDLFAASFTLYTGELAQLIRAVIDACGGEAE